MKRNIIVLHSLLFFIITFTLIHSDANAQFGLEVGAGHNQLFWKVETSHQTKDRLEFSVTPMVRISYHRYLGKHIYLMPFIGYNKFGGRSKKKANGYKDEYWIYAIDCGGIILFQIATIKLGMGFKYNRHLKAINRFYGAVNDPPETVRVWRERDAMYFFSKYSYDAGLRVDHLFFEHFIIAVEGWFGMINFEAEKYEEFISIHQNHYRIIVGYRF